MKKYLKAIVIFTALVTVFSCVSLSKVKKDDYGILKSAVMFSADKVIGQYGDEIPEDFDHEKFMTLMKNKIPPEYYSELKKYNLKIDPKGGYYYLLLVYKKDNLILFDYSCTQGIDGPILYSEKEFNLENLEQYNKCE